MKWLKTWWKALVAGLAVILTTVGALFLRRRVRRLGVLKDDLAVDESLERLAHLRGRREEVARRVGESDEQVADIDRKLAASRRAIVEAHENGDGLTDSEIEDAFASLGY